MRTWLAIVALGGLLGCAKTDMVAAEVGPPITIPVRSLAEQEEPKEERSKRFPAGPGAEVTVDDLHNVTRELAVVRNMHADVATRAGAIRSALKIKGIETEQGVAFYGVAPKADNGPYNCFELMIEKNRPAFVKNADRKHCGLPYGTRAPYVGPGPTLTLTRARQVLAEVETLSPDEARAAAKRKLGFPTLTVNLDFEWTAIGPRDSTAPVTCHVLHLGDDRKIEKRPLDKCGFTWPPPMEMFDAGPKLPPVTKAAALEQCKNTCSAAEMCVIDRRVPSGANVTVGPDGGMLAQHRDGRPAPIELVASCTPRPATCTHPTSACFFPPFPAPPAQRSGPCPADTYSGHSVMSDHVMCMSSIRENVRRP